MAEKDQDGPSLELPSLGFGRKRKKAKTGTEPEQSLEPSPEPQSAPEPPAEPAPIPEPAPGPEPTPSTVVEPAPEPATPEPDATPTAILDAGAPGTAARPLFADDSADAADQSSQAAPVATESSGSTESAETADDEAEPEKASRGFALPQVGGIPAAIVTGLLVGVLTVGLTSASLRLCEVLQGTSSCGGPGLFLLLAIMIAMIFLGAALLRAWGLPDPGSTSFLAVGLLAVVALLFLVDLLFNWWMIIVIPLVAMATFTLSHWVTATFIEPAEDR